MTANQSTPHLPRAALGPALWRGVRRAARALRNVHDEQVRMWECFWQASRIPTDHAGPLAWAPSLDGSRLTGSHLPGSAETGV